MTRMKPAALAVVLALAPAAALAHHGWSSYDTAKAATLTGPLTTVTWGNPHGTATMNWQNKRWAVILAPTTRMEARGLTREMLPAGKRITLTGYPRSDGTPEMRIERITVDGKTVELR